LQHFQVAIGVADCRNRTATYMLMDNGEVGAAATTVFQMRLVCVSNFGRGRGIRLSDSLAEDAFVSLFVSSTLAVRSGIVPSLFVANGR